MTVVTRFAPSPTGFLHIGGARTALFNWLYARGRGGKMLLRIEDTDRERSTQAAIDAILDGLNWLGIDWDGDAVFQFARAARHREVAEELLANGHAYRCYASPDELAQMREAARREGRAKLYDGRWRDRDPSEAPPGVKPAIRLKAPLTGETVIEDQVQGRVVWQNENLDDLVLLRSDGTPTYMLAVVVDDHDMGVTHIIRGDDHLTNARAAEADLRRARLAGAGDGAYPADPRPGRLKALQAPRRARRRCLSGHGLSAGGVAQLSGAARLEPRRPGDFLDRGDDRGVRSAADRPRARRGSISPSWKVSTATTSAKAATPNCSPPSIGCCPISPTAPTLAAKLTPRLARAMAGGHAEPEGARQDADRSY